MTISKIELLSIPVSDHQQAKDFYVDQLGFDVVVDRPMSPTARWIQLAPPGAATSITLVTWFESMPAGSLDGLVLATTDLDADVQRLRGRGITTSAVQTRPWGRYVTFEDPDGNGLILQQPPTDPA